LAVNESAAIEFRCRGTPQGREIATNSCGIREMSACAPLFNREIEAAAPSVGMTVTLAPHDDAAIEEAAAQATTQGAA